MKFLDGGSLNEHRGRLLGNPRAAAELIAQVARAVQHAHDRGILHRDLKPSNILLDADGMPQVADFGLAKRLGPLGPGGLSQSGPLIGTLLYMPPEQAATGHGLTVQADVYALGAILYELLTGRPPFRADNPLEILLALSWHEPIPPRALRPEVPGDLEVLCLKCLHKNPRQRYASARELAEDLERFLESRPILARPVGLLDRAWRWCRRNSAVASLLGALAVLVLLAGVGLGGMWRWGQRDRAAWVAEQARKDAETEQLVAVLRSDRDHWRKQARRVEAAKAEDDTARDVSRVVTALSTVPSSLAGMKIAFGQREGGEASMNVAKGLGIGFGGPTAVHLSGTFSVNNFGGLGGGL
jgi:hypothetical protein